MSHKIISKSDIRKIFPFRDENSHKGDNGRVCVIGGSIDYYGAPVFVGLGAVYSGADLVYMFVPEANFDASRSFYPDFIVRKFAGEYLDERDLDKIIELANKCQCVVIGPGLTNHEQTTKALIKLIPKITVPLVIDALALDIVHSVKLPYQTLLTPHKGEMERITGHILSDNIDEQIRMIQKLAETLDVSILMKGATDIIVKANGECFLNQTGNAGMTVGGSGDVLAGLIAGVCSQGASLFDSALIGSFCLGIAGQNLEESKGYAFSATDLALEIPYTLKGVLR